MSRFRSLLLWLMLLALPLQGWAAASMMFCGMASNPEAVQMQQFMGAQSPHSEHSHPSATQAGHLPADGVAALDKHDPSDALTPPLSDAPNQLPGAAHQCSVCATCCSLAALANHQTALHNHAVPSMAFAEPLALSYSVPPRLLERPPRA